MKAETTLEKDPQPDRACEACQFTTCWSRSIWWWCAVLCWEMRCWPPR